MFKYFWCLFVYLKVTRHLSIYDIRCIPSKQTAHCYGDILHDLCSSQYHLSTISIEQLLSRCLIWNQQKKPQKLLSKLILKCFASRHAIGEFVFFCVISWWRWFWSIPYVLIITIDILRRFLVILTVTPYFIGFWVLVCSKLVYHCFQAN